MAILSYSGSANPNHHCFLCRHRRWVVTAVVLPLLLGASETIAAAGDPVVVPASTECDPAKAAARVVSTSWEGLCRPGSHCVGNPDSSLGGYCIGDDHKATDVSSVPEAPQGAAATCYICEIPDENNDGAIQTRVVTAPHEAVGNFHCGELNGLGLEGKLPEESCRIFRQMIHEHDLCGCVSVITKGNNNNGALFAAENNNNNNNVDPPTTPEGIASEDDHSVDTGDDWNHEHHPGDAKIPNVWNHEDSATSGSSWQAIAAPIGVVAITMLMNFF